jgi:hypothetical protein
MEIDTLFGGEGTKILPFDENNNLGGWGSQYTHSCVQKILYDPISQKMIIGGTIASSIASNHSFQGHGFLMRVDTDGNVDNTFGNNGIVQLGTDTSYNGMIPNENGDEYVNRDNIVDIHDMKFDSSYNIIFASTLWRVHKPSSSEKVLYIDRTDVEYNPIVNDFFSSHYCVGKVFNDGSIDLSFGFDISFGTRDSWLEPKNEAFSAEYLNGKRNKFGKEHSMNSLKTAWSSYTLWSGNIGVDAAYLAGEMYSRKLYSMEALVVELRKNNNFLREIADDIAVKIAKLKAFTNLNIIDSETGLTRDELAASYNYYNIYWNSSNWNLDPIISFPDLPLNWQTTQKRYDSDGAEIPYDGIDYVSEQLLDYRTVDEKIFFPYAEKIPDGGLMVDLLCNSAPLILRRGGYNFFQTGSALCIDASNNIYFGGYTESELDVNDKMSQRYIWHTSSFGVIMKFDSNGVIDTTFNGKGTLYFHGSNLFSLVDFGNNQIVRIEDMVSISNNRFIASYMCGGGYFHNSNSAPNIVLACYNSDGTIDRNFAFDGYFRWKHKDDPYQKVFTNWIADHVVTSVDRMYVGLQKDFSGNVIVNYSLDPSVPTRKNFYYTMKISDSGVLDTSFGGTHVLSDPSANDISFNGAYPTTLEIFYPAYDPDVSNNYSEDSEVLDLSNGGISVVDVTRSEYPNITWMDKQLTLHSTSQFCVSTSNDIYIPYSNYIVNTGSFAGLFILDHNGIIKTNGSGTPLTMNTTDYDIKTLTLSRMTDHHYDNNYSVEKSTNKGTCVAITPGERPTAMIGGSIGVVGKTNGQINYNKFLSLYKCRVFTYPVNTTISEPLVQLSEEDLTDANISGTTVEEKKSYTKFLVKEIFSRNDVSDGMIKLNSGSVLPGYSNNTITELKIFNAMKSTESKRTSYTTGVSHNDVSGSLFYTAFDLSGDTVKIPTQYIWPVPRFITVTKLHDGTFSIYSDRYRTTVIKKSGDTYDEDGLDLIIGSAYGTLTEDLLREPIVYFSQENANMGHIPVPDAAATYSLTISNDTVFVDNSLNLDIDMSNNDYHVFMRDSIDEEIYITSKYNGSRITSGLTMNGTSGRPNAYTSYDASIKSIDDVVVTKIMYHTFNKVRIFNPGEYLNFAEIQVWVKGVNVALNGSAKFLDASLNPTTEYWGAPELAINGLFKPSNVEFACGYHVSGDTFELTLNEYILFSDLQSIVIFNRWQTVGTARRAAFPNGWMISILNDSRLMYENPQITTTNLAYKIKGFFPEGDTTMVYHESTKILDDNAVFTLSNNSYDTKVYQVDTSLQGVNPKYSVNSPVYAFVNEDVSFSVANNSFEDISYSINSLHETITGSLAQSQNTEIVRQFSQNDEIIFTIEEKEFSRSFIVDKYYAVTVSNDTYFINGYENPIIYNSTSGRYIFDQSDPTNAGYQLKFSSNYKTIHTAGETDAYVIVDSILNDGALTYYQVGNTSNGNIIDNITPDISINLTTETNTIGNKVITFYDVSENEYIRQMDLSNVLLPPNVYYFDLSNIEITLRFDTMYSSGGDDDYIFLDFRDVSSIDTFVYNNVYTPPPTTYDHYFTVTIGEHGCIYIDGVANENVPFDDGNVLVFDQTHVSNKGYYIVFGTRDSSNNETSGIQTMGTPGYSGYTVFTVPTGFVGTYYMFNYSKETDTYSVHPTFIPFPAHDYYYKVTIDGSGDSIFLNGDMDESVNFQEGSVYLFDVMDTTLGEYRIVFGEDNSLNFQTIGVVTVGEPTYNGYIVFTVPQGFTGTYYKLSYEKHLDLYYHPSGLTYTIANGEARVTSYNNNISTSVYILPSYQGNPVTGMDYLTFYNNEFVKEVTIPPSITEIESSTFRGCTSLETINLSGVIDIGRMGVYGCSSLKNIDTSYIKKLSDYAFTQSFDISANFHFVIADDCNITHAEYAFQSANITSLTFPNTEHEVPSQFAVSCIYLSSVTFTANTTYIHTTAFGYCAALTSVEIYSGNTIVQDDAFWSSPTVITYIYI